MAEKTGITWTDKTHNEWWGCTEVTDACDFCYAKFWAKRVRGMEWGKGTPRFLTSQSNRNLPLKWDRKAKEENIMIKVFAFSMADVFDVEVPDEWRSGFFNTIEKTNNIWWQLLTKRPSRPRAYNYKIDNVWLGTSVGSEKDRWMASEIIKAPAKLHWISYEPFLGPLDIYKLPKEITWVVIGGESGKNARSFEITDAISAVKACKETDRSIFVKQLGLKPTYKGKPYTVSDSHGKIMSEWPDELKIQEFPL